MNRQNINLYTDEFKPKKSICSFQHALVITAILIVCLCFQYYSANASYEKVNSQYQSIASKVDINELKGTVSVSDVIQAEVSTAKSSIQSQIDSLENMISIKKTLAKIIQNEMQNNLGSLYQVFTDIAKQSIENISVSYVGFYQKDNEVLISGLSRDKDSVTEYLSSVKEKKSFDKSSFGLLKIEKDSSELFYRFSMKNKNSDNRDYVIEKELLQEHGG